MTTKTKQQVNEAIAAWFEPKPDGERCAESAWKSISDGVREHPWRYLPLDWDTDEIANARLLEAMPFPSLVMWEGSESAVIVGKYWQCIPEHNKKLDAGAIHPDRKTAVVLAFCKFAGIDAEGEK